MENFSSNQLLALVIVEVWDLIWKGFALWRAAQHNQRNWFVALLLINSVGILPILYIKFFQKKSK